MNNIPVDESIVDDAGADADDDQMDLDAEPDSNVEPTDESEWGGIADADADVDASIDEDEDSTPAFFKELKAANEAAAAQKTQPKRPKTKVAAVVREKVRKVLEDVTGLAEKRSRMLDQNDFLKLLIALTRRAFTFHDPRHKHTARVSGV